MSRARRSHGSLLPRSGVGGIVNVAAVERSRVYNAMVGLLHPQYCHRYPDHAGDNDTLRFTAILE